VYGKEPLDVLFLRGNKLFGDGRAAAIRKVASTAPELDYAAISQARRCRLVLTSPGIFPNGWTLPGVEADGRFQFGEITGRLVCAASPVPKSSPAGAWPTGNRNLPNAPPPPAACTGWKI
jgi:CRISPR-associated protein Cmr3